jgi:hypothetical protein
MLQIFPKYTNRPTKKCVKEEWNNGYESDTYDEETGSWDYKSVETGPCYLTSTKYYISVFLKNKHHRSKIVNRITFYNDTIVTNLQAIFY